MAAPNARVAARERPTWPLSRSGTCLSPDGDVRREWTGLAQVSSDLVWDSAHARLVLIEDESAGMVAALLQDGEMNRVRMQRPVVRLIATDAGVVELGAATFGQEATRSHSSLIRSRRTRPGRTRRCRSAVDGRSRCTDSCPAAGAGGSRCHTPGPRTASRFDAIQYPANERDEHRDADPHPTRATLPSSA
jgi:hypothetical protein